MESNDWDLFAVVRGCRRFGDKSTVVTTTSAAESFEMTSFIDFSRLDELNYLFKSHTQQQQQQNLSSSSVAAGAAAALTRTANRSRRRRRIQQKKVVCQVPADCVSSDTWSWRKYGQKPIKGSPYPRGYYRCSSAKGCPARKQVERSRTDHGTFIITYTADHNHPAPAHGSSLAGSARHKPAAEAAELTSSPTTTLAASASTDEEEDEEGVLLVEDMEVVGEDEFFIVTDPAVDADDAANFEDIRFGSHPCLLAGSGSNAAVGANGATLNSDNFYFHLQCGN